MAILGASVDFEINVLESTFSNCDSGFSVFDIDSTFQSGGTIFHIIARNVDITV